MVAVAVREQHGDEVSPMAVNRRGQRLHVFAHANSRVNKNKITIGVAHEVAIGVVCGRKGGGFDGHHFHAVGKKNGATAGEPFSDITGRCVHVSLTALKRTLDFHQQGDHRRGDFDLVGFPSSEDINGFGPHDFGEFRLRFQIDVGDIGPVPEVEVKKGVVKLHRAEGWRDAMTEGLNVCAFNRERPLKSER